MKISGLAGFAASPEARLQYYQDSLADKESGVYEHEGDLYVHVKQVAGKGENRKRAEMRAVLFAKDLLTRWMIDHVAEKRREGERWLCPGLKRAVEVLDSMHSRWRFPDTRYDLNGQEINLGIKDGHYILCQMYSKVGVEKSIPEIYSQAPTEQFVRTQLKLMIPLALKENARHLYADCKTLDLVPNSTDLPFVREVADYLKRSEYAIGLRESMGRQYGPESVSWSDSPPEVSESKTEKVEYVTNAVECVVCVTNRLVRAQSREEKMAMGMALDGKVSETRIVSQEEEVEEIRRKTTVTIRKFHRVRTSSRVCGEPRFEKMLLSSGNGIAAKNRRVQTQLGAGAVKSFLGADPYKVKFSNVENALRENPYDADLWNMLGRLFIMRDDFLGALNCCRIVVKLDPRHAYALTNLALIYESLGAKDIAWGYAILVLGSADNVWCTTMAEKVLLNEKKENRK